MTRLSYLLYCWVTAVRYHAPRRLTKAGLLVGGGAILAGAIGSDLDQSVAFQTFALMLCLLLVAAAWAPFLRGDFALTRALPRLASVGEPFKYVVEVRNLSDRPHRGLELLEELADHRPGYREFAEIIRPASNWRAFSLAVDARSRLEQRDAIVSPARLPDLRPKGSARAEIQLVPLRRGSLRFCGMTVARADPLGLVRSFVRVTMPQRVLVLPQRHAIPPMAFPGVRHYQPGTMALASTIGQSEEYVSVREYRPGDAVRQIHWRSWARAGRPMVKECQDESAVRHGLLLDTFTRQGQETLFEESVSVAASFACTGPGQESMLDLLFVGGEAFSGSIGQSSRDSQRLLEVLAAVQPSRTQSLEAMRESLLGHIPVLGSCICVFLSWDSGRQELVRQLRSSGLPVLALLIVDSRADGASHELRPGGTASQVRKLRAGHIGADLQTLSWQAL